MNYVRLENNTVVEVSPTFIEGFIEANYDFVGLGFYSENGLDWTSPECNPHLIEDKTRIEKLWQAAHDYEYASVNGSGVGLVTMGVMSGKSKAFAVQNWVKLIWEEYYIRKANGSTNCDFNTVGVCPHTIPELMAELGL